MGLVDERVSLDGCESVASNYTELEMTTSNVVWIPSHALETRGWKGGGGGEAFWKGLCLAKRIAVKEKTVSDFSHFKQDLNRH